MRISSWKQESRKCLVCGAMFFPRQISQKYCSPECCRYAIVTAAVLLEEPWLFLILINRRFGYLRASIAEKRYASRKKMICGRSSARSAVKICIGSIPSGRSVERRNRAAFTAEIVGKKWLLQILMIVDRYFARKNAAWSGTLRRKKERKTPDNLQRRKHVKTGFQNGEIPFFYALIVENGWIQNKLSK